jgi:hypothetical protein
VPLLAGCGGGPGECIGFASSHAAFGGGGRPTPLEAAVAYAQPGEPPALPGLPTSGWHVAETAETGVVVRSGGSKLHATRFVEDGTWWIDSGEVC